MIQGTGKMRECRIE